MELNIFDEYCLKETISTVAGYGIVVFSSILKIPLILNILKSKSVDGLSTSSIYLEATMYAATLIYHIFLGSPFSTFGEKYALLLQNILISMLIWFYGGKSMIFVLFSIVGLCGVIGLMLNIPQNLAHYLVLYSSIGACVSRLPQIAENYFNGHTGVLSSLTLFLSVFGAVVRLLTVIQQVNDVYAILGECIPLSLNVVILAQTILYKSSTKRYFELKDSDKKTK